MGKIVEERQMCVSCSLILESNNEENGKICGQCCINLGMFLLIFFDACSLEAY